MNLRSVDLNLLVVLSEVLKARHLTLAAQTLHMSQPAVSHALSRARDLFQDRLLVRSGNQMLLTPRGLALQGEVERLLGEVRRLLNRESFDPAQAQGFLRLHATEGATMVLLTPVLAQVSLLAPHLAVTVSNEMADAMSLLRGGQTDLLLDVLDRPTPSGCQVQPLFANRLVCLARSDDDTLPVRMTPAEYQRRQHVAVEGGTNHYLEHYLVEAGVRRTVAMTMPGFVTAAGLASQSGLLLTVPSMLAAKAATLFPLKVVDLHWDIPPVTLSLIWHDRQHDDPAHAWVRSQILAMVERDLQTR